MELLPDVEEAFLEAKTNLKIKSEFPFASFFSLVGLFLVLSIEQFVWTCKSHEWPCCCNSKSLNHVHSFSSCDQNSSSIEVGDGPRGSNHEADSRASPERLSGTRFGGSQTDSISFELSPGIIDSQQQRQKQQQQRQSFTRPLPSSSTNQYVFDGNGSPRPRNLKQEHAHHSHLPAVDNVSSLGSIMRLILLLCAMSVHSLFEGLAVGLQPTSQRTIALFSAILLHKLIIATGIGVNLATNLSNSQTSSGLQSSPLNRALYYQILGILLLASASPIGVLIGWTLIERQQSGLLLMSTAVLQALACGTFFYVVFCELLPVEFHEGSKNRIGKLVFLIAGFMVVALYAYLMPE